MSSAGMSSAGIVLAGGRSARMGTPKAALEWHGSTLLRRTVGILARATGGPVVVVRSAGQPLPALPRQTGVVDDPQPGLGPLQGIAAGLAAVAASTPVAFVSSTDLPFLHPAFVALVLAAVTGGVDAAVPLAHGHPQLLAAGYRTALAPAAQRLVGTQRLRLSLLLEGRMVAWLDEAALRGDPVLAALDPDLDSVVNVNGPGEYRRARARPAPEVTVRLGGSSPQLVRAATMAAAAAGAGLAPATAAAAVLNGEQVADDGETPLATGDSVVFRPAAVLRASALFRAGRRAGP
jgi:molybdopterin-guanine dinucleotide biosynthesis protein A